MKKQWVIGITSLSLAVVGISSLTSETPENAPEKSHSTYKEVLKTNVVQSQSAITKSLMYEADTKLKDEVVQTTKLKKKYYENFNKEPQEISANLEVMEKEHYKLLTAMREAGVTIDPVTNLKPRLALALSYNLNLHVSELTAADLDGLKLSNQEWYLIKTFSESNDFKIMLKRNTLTTSFVQLENLASIY